MRHCGRIGLKGHLEKSQDTSLDFKFYFLLCWQQRIVTCQRATFRVVREDRESSEGSGPSAGQCSLLRAREESWLEVFSPTSRILPISLLVCKEGAHLEKI